MTIHIKLTMELLNQLVIGSGGVNKAAAANIITTTYFLLFKNSESTNPTLANKLKTTGN